MIKEDYVSFETAKLLKEKGFDAKCRYYYIRAGEMFEVDTRFHSVLTTQELLNLQIIGEKEERCIAPTLQMAMKWLREIYEISIDIHILQGRKVSYMCNIWDFSCIHDNKFIGGTYDLREQLYGFDTYEEAAETAIRYCLENLI